MIKKIRKFLNERPLALAYICIVLAMCAGFWYQSEQAKERKQQICFDALEERLLIEDILNFVGGPSDQNEDPIDPNLPPEVQKLIEQSRERSKAFREFADERIKIPPTICKGTGITSAEVRRVIERRN